MNILIADDDRVQTHMLSSRLKVKGFKVTVAYDAIQAWIAAIRTLPDAIILDIQMPGGTGFAVLKQLKSSEKTKQIPVVVVSGSIDPQAVETVKALGANHYLSKPVDMPSLFSCLSSLLEATVVNPPATP